MARSNFHQLWDAAMKRLKRLIRGRVDSYLCPSHVSGNTLSDRGWLVILYRETIG